MTCCDGNMFKKKKNIEYGHYNNFKIVQTSRKDFDFNITYLNIIEDPSESCMRITFELKYFSLLFNFILSGKIKADLEITNLFVWEFAYGNSTTIRITSFNKKKMYNTENGTSEASFDILPRFTTWTYCKHKTRRYKHNFSTKGATQNSWTLEEKQTKSLKQKPYLKVR